MDVLHLQNWWGDAMNIAYFPSIYVDELFYSTLSRFASHTGIAVYRDVASILFQNPYHTPSIEFINNFSFEAKNIIEKQCSMEELVEKHTMFPMYMRFYPLEKRVTSFQAFVEMESNKNILPRIANKNIKRTLRYCPLCVKEDREQHGECYWHRSHQLVGIEVCHKHNCYLKDSGCLIDAKVSPGFHSLELSLANMDVEVCKHEHINNLAKMMVEVFQSPISFDDAIPIGEYLGASMDVKYVENRLERDLQNFYHDYQRFYEGMNEVFMMNVEQISKVFGGKRHLLHEICQLALFEGISVKELLHPDRERLQKEKDVIYARVSEKIGVDYTLVKTIGDAIIIENQTLKQNSMKTIRSQGKWEKEDEATLPKVIQAIKEMEQHSGKPIKVSVAKVNKMLGLPDKRMDKLPLCKNAIMEHMESQEHYWSRVLIWALQEVKEQGKTMNWKSIRTLTSLRKSNVEVTLVELKEMDINAYELVQSLL